MSTVESIQHTIGQLLRVVDIDLNGRGVLMVSRAQTLLAAVKHAQLQMSLCERTTPADFFNDRWHEQHKTLQQYETRLTRIIKGVAIPVDDHEATR